MNGSLREIHLQGIKAIKEVNLLNYCSWPIEVEQEFLASKGERKVISVNYNKPDFSENKKVLEALLPSLSVEDPLEVYTRKTIKSYIHTIDMISSIGTSDFQDLGIEVYGTPSVMQFGRKFSHLDMANKILQIYKEFDHSYLKDPEICFSSKEIIEDLQKRSFEVLGEDTPRFVEDAALTSKAAAGMSRIRLRKGTCFSEYDFNQLFEHEVMTHSLTAINGSKQELPLFGSGAPRTTKTQEGLATFSEIITGNMDILRLKRLALRIVGIDKALKGADFYDLYDFFMSYGQNEKESFLSASRVLRGGTAKGGIVFTKDNVYLEGLFMVHSFFLWALHTSNLDCIHILFSGRVDIEDIFLLKDEFEKGNLKKPKYLPNWYKNINLLVGKISFSLLLDNLNMKEVDSYFSKLQSNYHS
ncbi:MAG: hypothetical protein ACJAT2_000538 [Bacteriovoracaceae bacterium]